MGRLGSSIETSSCYKTHGWLIRGCLSTDKCASEGFAGSFFYQYHVFASAIKAGPR